MLNSALQNVRVLTATLFLAAIALIVIPVSAQKPGGGAPKQLAPQKSTSRVEPVINNYRSPGQLHKVSVRGNPQLVASLQASGGRIIADYGSFVLLEVNEAVANGLANDKGAQVVDENNVIQLNAGAIDTSNEKSTVSASLDKSGKQMRLIQFVGPIRPEWFKALVNTGVHVVTYIPNNAYLVYGDAKTLQAVHQLATDRSIVQWEGEYTAAHRLDPAVTAAPAQNQPRPNLSARGNEQFVIQMVNDKTENQATLALIDRNKAEPIIHQESVLGYVNVKVAMPRDAVRQIAERGDVVSIQQYVTPVMLCERQDQIMAGNLTGNSPSPGDYLAYLTGKGFNLSTPSTFGVNISDSGFDNGTTTPWHFVFYTLGDPTSAANSRISYVVNAGSGTATDLTGCNGHGHLNTSIIGGYVPTGVSGGVDFGAFPHADASGFRWSLGIAPFVKVGMSVIFSTTGGFLNPNFSTLESNAYAAGMRISSNSWGAAVSGAYTSDSQTYDSLVRDAQSGTAGNQEYTIVFSAGNSGSGSQTIGSPSTGKNIITVGAAEDVNPFGGADGCGIGDTGADSANDIISFSSRGPTADQRKKPEIVGPGTHVSGAAPQSGANTARTGNGSHLACFTASGVCGGVGIDFFPSGQEWYTASSGTSHSCPAVSGTLALYRQYFINNAMTPPSPALNRALLMNSARYMNGAGANDTLWSNSQGMGEADLNNFFDIFASAHSLHDESPGDLFTATGQQRTTTGTVGSAAKPFRVTLAWTEPPGPTSGNSYVNNLDLEVTVGGNTYKGNVFSGAFSATGGTADTRDNVESVFVPAGVSGNYVVKVIATNIAGDGVPGNGSPLDQDYALVVYNGNETPAPVISTGATAITAESCAPANNAIDPGEMVTLNFGLANVGTANTTNLVATLQSGGGVSSPSGPQNYGALVAMGAPVTRPFTFTASTTCGQPITATFHLQDGANDLGNVTFSFQTGALGAAVMATYSTGNISVAIPDVSTVEVPINITDTGVISDVNAKVRLNHTYDGDLILELVGPDNTSVTLSNRHGGTDENYGSGASDCSGTHTVFDDSASTPIASGTAPYVGSFKPDSPLSAFNGKLITGTWKLRVTDAAAADVGTIYCVQLEITRQRFACCGVAGTPQIISGGAPVIIAENYFPPNSTPDPGESLTINFPVVNVGDGNTTNLVATLQHSGGVTPVTTSQNYGVVVAAGPAVSRSFTLSADPDQACGDMITATLHLQDGALDLGNLTYTFQLGGTSSSTQTFSNPAVLTIPASGTGASTGAPATPYPSNITVSGAPTTISNVTVTLAGLAHTFPGDIDALLVSPNGQKFIVMSDVIGGTDWTGQTYTFDDAAAALMPSSGTPPANGTFKPTNYSTGDAFPAPAPAAPYLSPATAGSDTLTSAFAGMAGGNPNGTWSLYVVDDAGTDVGTMNGWQLTLTTSTPVCALPVACVSRKMHSGTPYDVPLPLVGARGVECRAGQGAGGTDHQMVVTFSTPVTVGSASVTFGTGSVVGSPIVAGNIVTINLTGVTNAQTIVVTLSNVSDGVNMGNLIVPMGVLQGDTSGNGTVSSTDVSQTKSRTGQSVSASNFREDVNVSGSITATDVSTVKSRTGTALP